MDSRKMHRRRITRSGLNTIKCETPTCPGRMESLGVTRRGDKVYSQWRCPECGAMKTTEKEINQ